MCVSGGSDTKNTEETKRFILIHTSERYVEQCSDLRIRNAQSGDYISGKRGENGSGSLGAILVL